MNRFRKKSDAKRAPFAVQVSSSSVSSAAPSLDTALPALPEINDFRTSLILPNLGKRFSILRNAQGHSTLDSLRSKFAEQRAKGADNHITEEEEEMMLEALTSISKGASTTPSRVVADEEELDYLGDYYTSSRTSSTPSSSTATTVYPRSSAATDSPQSQRTSKRNSSNLFGSGRHRDQSYIRSARERVTSQTSSVSSPRDRLMSLDGSNSASMTAAMTRENSSSTLATVPDTASEGSGSGGGKDTDKTPVAKLLNLGPSTPAPAPAPEPPRAAALSPAQQRRMSRALESALLELTGGAIPDEDDDIIVAPRSARSPPPSSSPRAANGPASPRPPPLQRDLFNNMSGNQHAPQPPQSAASDTASDFMRGDDDPFASYKRVEDLINRNGSAPTPPSQQRAPVSPSSMYIPGMQRPTSPRDVASYNHDQRADSTTPRATQPQSPSQAPFRGYTGRAPNSPPHLPASILRSALPRSDSPAFGMHQPSHSKSSSFGSLADLGRFRKDSPGPEREPVSILKQTRPISPPTSGRTPTPVNASRDGAMPAWLANANYYQQHISRGATPEYGQASTPGHSRRGSALSDESDPYGTNGMRGRTVIGGHQRTKSNASVRSLTSPALPDSPLIDGTAGVDYGSLTGAWDLDARMSSIDIGRPAAVDLAAQAGRPSTPRSPPFLARSPSLTRSPSQTRGYESDYSIGRQQFSSTPPPGPSAGLGRPRTPSRSAHHSPASSASSSFNNIHSAASNPLVLSPFNASAASVASAGSSYHSEPGDEVEEKLYALLHPGNKKRKWDDFAGELAGAARLTVLDEHDGPTEKTADEILKGLTGLTKDDIVVIQTRLLNAALQMKSTVEPPPSRPPSLRRRRGSIGQTMGVQSPSRTTSPGPVSPHVSPKTSQSPFNASNGHPLAALGSSSVSTPSAPPSSSSGSSAAILPSAPPASQLSPSSPPYSAATLTGSDTEREKTPAPRQSDRGARANALLTSMMDSIDSKKPTQPLSGPGYVRPLSPQLQSPPRAMSPVPAASAVISPARAKSPPLMRAKSPPVPADLPVRAKSPVLQQLQKPTVAHHEPQSSQSSELSSILRNQALADAIFGLDEDHPVSAAQAQELAASPTPPEEEEPRHPSPPPTQRALASPSPVQQRYGSPPPESRRYGSPSPVPHEYSPSPDFQGYSPSPNKQSYNSASPLPPDDAQLEQDVRRKVELATQQLKQSSSQVSLRPRSDSVRRKKIDPNKISAPHLMSASTSVEHMPSLSPSISQLALQSPSEPRSAGSKLSQRFKKLGWRNKPSTPNSDEPPPFGHGSSSNMQTPTSASTLHPQIQTVRINPGMGSFNGPASASLADVSQYRFPPTSPGYSPQTPPASAGPAFKSFMSKFAKPFGASSTDLAGVANNRDRERLSPHSPNVYTRSPTSPTTPTAFASSGRTMDGLPRGTPPPHRYAHPGGTPTSPLASDSFARGRPSMDDASTPKSPEMAFKQILDGAAQVGLNPTQMEELSAFLSRSLSTSSRAAAPQAQSPTLTRNNSIARPISPPAPERKPTVRAARARSPGPTSRATRDDNARSVVVRRTIYLTTDNRPILPPDGNPSISRRPSHRKQGSESGLSARSGKSVQERVNTPPPRSVPTRFSAEAPPVPLLSATYLDATMPGGAGASSSSLVDPYGGAASIAPSERDRYSSRSPYPASLTQRNGEHGTGAEPQQALEVLEFSDGRVVWQIVDGLRAGDDDNYDNESEFRSRASFDSGYSVGEREPELQLHVREHKRLPSKGSANSSAFNRKSTFNRPETKVFYTDQEQIGRLIENMTKGMNSGSFNVVPAVPTAASGPASETQSTQDLTWTMEEHLEHVLGSLNHRPTSP